MSTARALGFSARSILLCSLAAVTSSSPSHAAEELTLERIMAHPDWIGRAPENPYWADDGGSIYYQQKQEGSEERRLFQMSLDGKLIREVAEAQKGTADVAQGEWSHDRLVKVYSREGDLFVRERQTGHVRQLTRTVAEESQPRFLRGDQAIWFHRNGSIFVRELESGLEYEPAVLRFENDPGDREEEDYLSAEQHRLIRYLREQREKKEASSELDRKARLLDATRVPSPFYLGEELELKASSLSPNGRYLLVVLLPKERKDGKRDHMPNYITESSYAEADEVRVTVGTATPTSDRLLLVDLQTRERKEIVFDPLPGIDEDPLKDLRDRTEPDAPAGSDRAESAQPAEKARPLRIGDSSLSASSQAGIHWRKDGDGLMLQIFSHDNKDRWIADVDLSEGELRPLLRMQDEAWINWRFNELGWLEDGARFYYTSEESGYSQLYLYSTTEGKSRRLTDGNYVVSDVQPSPDGRFLYYTANPDHPGIYETFRYDLERNSIERLTNSGGRNDYLLSPDGTGLLLTRSRTTMPPELYFQPARPAEARKLTDTVSPAFREIAWVEPEVVAIPSSHHDRPIYSRIYRPTSTRPSAGGPRPAVVFVHGAGYLQNAHQGWSGYFREFMFHSLLNERGYVVLDMDYRASAGYGRDWRTAIYRQMGTPELEDLEDGVRYLVANEGVDAGRIGVYGGSYGGFLTLMSLFKKPDLFACGAALRPVTDWAHYNHPYTSRILNTPTIDPEAYQRSSPIELAEGLTKPLLIAHGMLDDNVFFKDSVRLVQRLIELEKHDWEIAIFPVEPHGFREPSSWLDEYRRIFRLFETYLK